jgi:hypothetical protein
VLRLSCFRYVLCLFVLALLAQPISANRPADVIGEAYDPQEGELLYSEHHYCDASWITCRIVYRDLAQNPIAYKDVDYSSNSMAPSLRFSDTRFDGEFTVLDRAESDGVVVDAGFDNFMRSRWLELSEGSLVDFQLQLLGRDKPLKMIAQSSLSTDCDMEKLCIEVALSSWVLRMLVQPIQLTYDRESRRLMNYRGISNLPDNQGKPRDVEIFYQYQDLNQK